MDSADTVAKFNQQWSIYMRAKLSYEGIQRIERYFVPEAALRETLLNAVCHKQYQSGVPIQISVYEDRLYVANVGSLPEEWTLEKLLNKHTSKPYNPNIAYVFYLAGFIESWGRGVEKICNALRAENLPMPEYTVNPGDIMIKFTGPEDRIIRVTDIKMNNRMYAIGTEYKVMTSASVLCPDGAIIC